MTGVVADRVGPVTLVTIDRPKRRNAVDQATAIDLHAAFRAFDRDPTSDVAVLTGAGGAFCAGADLQAFAALALAEGIARLPRTGLRSDRASLLEQWDLTETEAIGNEVRHGLATIASGETLAGAARFAGGAGRHGQAAGDPSPSTSPIP
jgi:enoyl-CoA hydratase